MSWAVTIPGGVSQENRSGGCSSWNGSSILLPLCRERNSNTKCEDVPTPTKVQWPRTQVLSNWQYEPCWVLHMTKSWNWLKRFTMVCVLRGTKHPPHWCKDQLMSDLHEELGQWLGRADLHGALQMAPQCRWSATCSDRSQSRGRTHSNAQSSSWVRMPWKTNRQEGTMAPSAAETQPYTSQCSLCTGPTQSHIPSRHEGQTPIHPPTRARHEFSETTSIRQPWEASLRGCS